MGPGRARRAFARFDAVRASNVILRAHYLTRGSPDVLHFAFSGTGIAWLDALEVLEAPRPKTVVSCRGTAEKVMPYVDVDRGPRLRALFGTIDRVHCVSHDMLVGLGAFGLSRDLAFVNYPAVDLEQFVRSAPYKAVDRETWRIISTGGLSFQKGYLFALLALRELKSRGVAFRYQILGDGPDREMLTYVVHELALSDDVTFLGRIDNLSVRRALEEADVFVLPSLSEGIANAVLEAMAMELPVVTTDAGGMREVIKHADNGMLVPWFDARALADALGELFASRELRARLSSRARATVEREFSLETQLDTFVAEYRALVSAR